MFTENLYYGNTILDWIIAGGYIIASVVVGRILYWLFKLITKRFASKSATKLDDILLDMIEEPFTFVVVLYGIKFSLQTLDMSDSMLHVIEYAFNFILTLAVTWMISRLYNALHKEYLIPMAEKTATDLDDHLLPIVRKGIIIGVWSVGVLIALNNAGYDVTAILAGLGIGGLAFALAVKATFSNILSGLIIYFDGHFKVGDRIQLQGDYSKIDGVVTDIGLRTTRIKTRYEGRIVNIPNVMFTTQEVINVETEDGRQVFQVYKLKLGTPSEKVEAMMALLKAAVKETEGTKELCVTGVVRVSEVSIDVMHLYWVQPDSSNVKTKSAVYMNILKAMEREGIELSERTALHYNLDAIY
ncbi:MAG: mechanosensitive ion channel family protein [Cyclobacteriaceae bacterium]